MGHIYSRSACKQQERPQWELCAVAGLRTAAGAAAERDGEAAVFIDGVDDITAIDKLGGHVDAVIERGAQFIPAVRLYLKHDTAEPIRAQLGLAA